MKDHENINWVGLESILEEYILMNAWIIILTTRTIK